MRVVRVPIVFVNAYLVETDIGITLVDTGIAGAGAALIERALRDEFGTGAGIDAIVLTHGHFDHAGSAAAIARRWKCSIFAHRMELPYLTGRSSYPPQDPTVGGMLANLSRVFPRGPLQLGDAVRALDPNDDLPLSGWRAVHTPGHTPGHISLFRESDGYLLAGDAVATMNQESAVETVLQHRQLRQPPAAFTPDWDAAEVSIRELALLSPRTVAAGHGLPISGPPTADAFAAFARDFRRPPRGRYVNEPALADEDGVIRVPPPVADPVGRGLVLAGVVGLGLAITSAVGPRRSPRRR